VLSRNFAGDEFELNQPSMVVGRTEDNDIWLDHRSISRHHAKFVHENGRYAIVDLNSANGVRVNGEEYGKVDLRRGDLVDLGHVRLRFVEPGEDFLFGRDAEAVDLEPERRRGLLLWLLLAAGVAAALGAFFLSLSDTREDAVAVLEDGPGVEVVPTEPAVGENPADPGSLVEPPGPDTPDGPSGTEPVENAEPETPDVPDKAEQVAQFVAAAKQAIAAEDWSAALEATASIEQVDPGNAYATKLAARAKTETANRKKLAELQACDPQCVLRKWKDIPEQSFYAVRARQERDKAEPKYLALAKTRASQRLRRAKTRGQCARDLRRLASAMGGVLPAAGELVRTEAQDCAGKPEKIETPVVTEPVATTPPKPVDVESLVREAQKAAKAGHTAKAFRLCKQALNANPGNPSALVVCALSACKMKNNAAATRYVGRIRSAGQKSMLRQVCLTNGVEISGD